MRIVDVKAYPLRATLANPTGNALAWNRARVACLVEVITDEGLSGWGESGAAQGLEVLATVVEKQLRPLLIGEDPTNTNRLWEKMFATYEAGGRTSGISLQAVSGVDIALWDLRGKIAGKPVYELLGGKVRDSVLGYATGFYYSESGDPVALVEQEARRHMENGFRAIKVKIGGLPIKTDAKRVEVARGVIGPDGLLMIDANQAYTVAAARDLARRVADHEIGWFEEPLPAHELRGYLQLKGSIGMPIATGECVYTRFGYREWCAQQAMDVAQPDLCNAGGITECARIASMVNAWGMLCVPHAWGTPVGLSATLQLALTLPPATRAYARFPLIQEPALECDQSANPLREEVAPMPFKLKDGVLTAGDAPGLGVEVDRSALDRFLVR